MKKLILAIALLFAAPAFAQQETPPSPIVTAQLLLHAPTVKQGEPIAAGVLFTIPREWHIYWQNPGDSGLATSLTWTLPDGIQASEIDWPVPERIETSGLFNYGYSEKVILPVTLTPLQDGISGPVSVKVEWLVCKDICIPESATLTGTLPATDPQGAVLLANAVQHLPTPSEATASYAEHEDKLTLMVLRDELKLPDGTDIVSAEWFPIEDGIVLNNDEQEFSITGSDLERDLLNITMARGSKALPSEWSGLLLVRTHPEEDPIGFRITAHPDDVSGVATTKSAHAADLTLLTAIVFAFLGGIILNLMPCVLPILSLKALALAKKSGAEARAAKTQGFAYTAGVIVSFLAIAALMLALKSGGAAIGWGFQLQEPAFIAALFFLMLLVALNLFGLFDLPVLFGNATADSHSTRGAFLTGALAVLLATPCTAPFMAPALGATLTFSALGALLVFAALGFGMALPFLLISIWPPARRALPKPGPWMGRFKQFLAFPMLATAAWLLWVLNRTTGDTGLILALVGGLLISWLVWWAHGTRDRSLRRVLLISVAAVAAWAISMQPNPGGVAMKDGAIAFDHGKLAELRDAGTPVFVDATADWCITCKINERIALRDNGIEKLFAERGVQLMIADWTKRDAAITVYLASFGRNGVPLYVYYPPKGEPVVLPQLLTPATVRAAIEQN